MESMEKAYTIELFSDKDQEEVAKLGLGISQEMGQEYKPELDYDWDHIQETFIAPGGVFYVVRSGGEIIGCGGIKKKSDEIAEFKRARILKEWRGKGIGSELLDMSLNFARTQGFKKVILDTTEDSMRRVSEKAGFKKFRQEGNFSYYEKDL